MEQQAIQSLSELSQIIWLLVCVVLVLLMLVGFLCIEAGSIQKKNNVNAAIKSVVNLCVVFSMSFLLGFSLMYGDDRLNGWVGDLSFFLSGMQQQVTGFLLHAAFCCICVAIVGGAIAERCKLLPFILLAVAIALFIYPLFGHWVWGEGWLYAMGFYDYGGAAVVHVLGASIALAAVKELGPRKSYVDRQGNLLDQSVSNAPLYSMGVLLLLIGWFGMVGSMAGASQQLINIMINTCVAAAFGGLTGLLATWAYLGLANIQFCLRGLLAALVAITAAADVVSYQSAMIIGVLAGGIVPLSLIAVRHYRLDDATGAITVHGVAGILGLLLLPLLIQPQSLALLNQTMQQQHDLWSLFKVQCLGAVVCVIWGYTAGLLMVKLFKWVTIFRLWPEQEKIGLNYTEHMSSTPLHELNTAVELIRREQFLEAKAHFDRLENSDLEGLSYALRELLHRNQRDG